GCREKLAPDFLAMQRFLDIAFLVLVRTKGDDGRNTHAQTDGKRRNRGIELALFLIPDHLLHRRAAAPANFLGPCNLGELVFRLDILPLLGLIEIIFAASGTQSRLVFGFQMLAQKSMGFSPERSFFW